MKNGPPGDRDAHHLFQAKGLGAKLGVIVSRNKLPAHDAWLFFKKSIDSGEIKYSLANAPEDIPLDELVRVSSLRWPIEQCFQDLPPPTRLGTTDNLLLSSNVATAPTGPHDLVLIQAA
jgi:hypothetical protein